MENNHAARAGQVKKKNFNKKQELEEGCALS